MIAGDGPERARLEALVARARPRRPRALPGRAAARRRSSSCFAAADAVLLSSSWENFPHAVVEGLAVGTPVIATGGRRRRRDRHGRRERPARPARTTRRRSRARSGASSRDEELRERLRAAARGSVAGYAPERVYARLEALLQEAAA